MQLIIKGGKIIAMFPKHMHISPGDYPGSEIILYDGPLTGDVDILQNDPRTEKQKREYYKDQRRLEYPSVERQLDLMYWDKINGTEDWVTAIAIVKTKYPKVN